MPETHDLTTSKTDTRRFFWRLLLGASLIAATVSLLTTGLGLDRYVAFPIAWSLALAVQAGLFGLAWLIGVGGSRHRGWLSALYILTMLFSVTFSYVTLQSEFTKEIRPAEAQRRLFDTARASVSETARRVNNGVSRSEDLELRLRSWVETERQAGWTTRTCEEEDHCYLQEVCDRIRRRISTWEAETGQRYREGPGEALIFSALSTELTALQRLGRRLGTYRDELSRDGVFDSAIDNRERLRRLDTLFNRVPAADLEAVTCDTAALPTAPSYEDHARDLALDDEQPVYAWVDLTDVFLADRPLRREDYPTIFAFCLALFIDLFVLAVALGASVIEDHGDVHALSDMEGVPKTWEAALQSDIRGWIDAAILAGRGDPEGRRDFLRQVLAAITVDPSGTARLVPEDEGQRRFGHLLVHSKAARMGRFVRFNRIGKLFLLEDWVYPALTRHLSWDGGLAAAGA